LNNSRLTAERKK